MSKHLNDGGDPSLDGFDEDLLVPEPAPRAAASAPRGKPKGKKDKSGPSLLKAFGLGALICGIGLGMFFAARPMQSTSSELPSGHPAVSSSAVPTTAPTLDEAKVSQLKSKLTLNPTDVASLEQLASLYSEAGRDGEAVQYQQKAVDVDPTDTDARTILGVYAFNNSDIATAEQAWTTVTQQDPKNAEAYYDLGYLYMMKQPADTAKTQAMWQKVVEIAPDSDMAKQVGDHIGALQASASSSPTPTTKG